MFAVNLCKTLKAGSWMSEAKGRGAGFPKLLLQGALKVTALNPQEQDVGIPWDVIPNTFAVERELINTP